MTQNNLGSALSSLGEREDGTERLKKAVNAHRAALQVYTRERVPLRWAMTQNNLGSALGSLGEREDGTERLKKAVNLYRAALEGAQCRRVPRVPKHSREESAPSFEEAAKIATSRNVGRLSNPGQHHPSTGAVVAHAVTDRDLKTLPPTPHSGPDGGPFRPDPPHRLETCPTSLLGVKIPGGEPGRRGVSSSNGTNPKLT